MAGDQENTDFPADGTAYLGAHSTSVVLPKGTHQPDNDATRRLMKQYTCALHKQIDPGQDLSP